MWPCVPGRREYRIALYSVTSRNILGGEGHALIFLTVPVFGGSVGPGGGGVLWRNGHTWRSDAYETLVHISVTVRSFEGTSKLTLSLCLWNRLHKVSYIHLQGGHGLCGVGWGTRRYLIVLSRVKWLHTGFGFIWLLQNVTTNSYDALRLPTLTDC
jgi:hypothetical protein